MDFGVCWIELCVARLWAFDRHNQLLQQWRHAVHMGPMCKTSPPITGSICTKAAFIFGLAVNRFKKLYSFLSINFKNKATSFQ